MNIISWNMQGLNGRSKQSLLQNHIMNDNSDVLFLQEKKSVGTETTNILSWC